MLRSEGHSRYLNWRGVRLKKQGTYLRIILNRILMN